MMNVLAHKDYSDSQVEEPALFLNETETSITKLLQQPLDQLMAQAAEKDITLFYEPTKININLKIDQQKIRQAVTHVVNNAIRFSYASSSVYVSTGCDFNGDAYIRIDDEGPGIDSDMLERTFEPFTKVKNGIKTSSENTGRGLSMINAYLKMHFGYIRIQSTPSRGTSVTLTLPKSCIIRR
uniref:histidine kinase n=1 Tax=OCS116 cluster bacterium TaxID=2030921 RepID=A0A2A4Z9G4_9PROT